jgi:hypothetical protein
MTYNEAIKFRDDNWKDTQPRLVYSVPPHMIERTIIAPEKCDLNTLIKIDSFLHNSELGNDVVLQQMGILDNRLGVYVVFKTQGHINILSFNDYKSIDWAMEDDGSGNRS